MEVFIYTPKTGSRIFASHLPEDGTLALVTWGNMSHHVYGDGVHLQYLCAERRAWCRSQAKVLAAAIVTHAGGVAWDDRGVIHLAVPRRAAYAAHGAMEAVGGISPTVGTSATPPAWAPKLSCNESRLVAEGVTSLALCEAAPGVDDLGFIVPCFFQLGPSCLRFPAGMGWRAHPMPRYQDQSPISHQPLLSEGEGAQE